MNNLHNVLSILNMMRSQGVVAYKNHHGQVVFSGMTRLTKSQKDGLMQIPQKDLLVAMRWQKE